MPVEKGRLRSLTHHNEKWLKDIKLAKREDINFKGVDGETVYGMLTKPVGYKKGKRYPTILWMHGGAIRPG